MKYFISFLLIIAANGLHAQYNPEKIGKKATNLYNKAIDQAREGNFPEGIKILQEAIKAEPRYADALLSMAGMYGELKDYENAIIYYERAKLIDKEYFSDYNLPYSINLAGKGEFEKALAAINVFMAIPNLRESSRLVGAYRAKTYQFAIDYNRQLQTKVYDFEPRNLGDNINSRVSEYFPSISLDGQKLVYTRRVGNFNEDFFEASADSTGWSQGRALLGNINSQLNEGAQNISQDGQWLIFTGCNFPDGFGSCDLYISYLTENGWSEPENMGRRINSESWESAPSLSPDKRDLYFTSNRPGGFGGNDLYVSHRLPNGTWTSPMNLGSGINTLGNESAPFIHADNQTLFFTSNGLLGYGEDDLFLSRKSDSSTWQTPVNLGFPINTIENEGSLVVASDGQTAYFASDRNDSRGGLDIYSFQLREDVRPARTLWVKGKVFDKETTKGLPSAVELINLETKTILSKVQTDETGNYLVTLPVGKDYAFNVNRKGYLFFSENFPLSEKQPDSTYNIDIPLQPIKEDASIVLKNIFFDINSFELKEESTVELDRMVELLKENPTLRIQINGHTDNAGQPASNLELSRNRARSVVNYLVSKGIDAKRLSFNGYGETRPIETNNTEEGRAKNRRTEMKVLSR